MKDEIKEILELLKDTADLSFFAVCGTKEEMENMPKCISKRLAITDEQAKVLLDYITNLQQENERLKEDKKKAVEYIKTTKFLYKSHYDFKQDLLNILQNGSEKDEC